MADQENRQQERLDLSKLVFAKEGEEAHAGLIRDISAGGAYVEFHMPLGRVEHSFEEGDTIDLIMEDETVLVGVVRRADTDGIAIAFDPAAGDQFGFVQAMVDAEREAREEE